MNNTNTKQRTRIINFRCFLLGAASMVCAIFLGMLFFASSLASMLLLFLLLGVLVWFFARNFANRNNSHAKKAISRCISFGICIVLSLGAYIVVVHSIANWLPVGFKEESVCSVSGTIDSNVVKNGNRTIVLNNVTLNGKSVNGRIRVYLSEEEGKLEFAKEGDILTFSSKIFAADIFKNYRANQRFYANIAQDDATLEFGSPSFLQGVRTKIKQTLADNLKPEYAEICYSMLTGDKNTLPMEISDYFRASGLAHILAVSGLHVGFLIALLLFVLRKFKAHRVVIFAIVGIVLIGYVFVADFSPSVIRAAIMGVIGLITMLSGRPRDSLNSLCCAACLILFFRPLYIFDVGFLMSVFAVLGIILFASPIIKGLGKIKFPPFLASTIAVPISAQLGILPVSIYFFRSVSLYSLLANVLLSYIIMGTFILLVIGVSLAVFLPTMGFVIKVAGLGIFVIDESARIVASLPLARIIVFSTLPIFVCYLIYFTASRFVNKGRIASVASFVCMLLCAAIIAGGNLSINIKNTIIPVKTEFFDVTSVVNVESKVYVIGDLQNYSDVVSTLFAIKARRVDAVFINRLNEKTARQLVELEYIYGDFTVYFPLTQSMDGLDILLEKNRKLRISGFEESTALTSGISSEYHAGRFLCYRLQNQITALFFGINGNPTSTPINLLDEVGVLRSYGYAYISSDALQTRLINIEYDNGGISDDAEVISMTQESGYVIYYYLTTKTKRVAG